MVFDESSHILSWKEQVPRSEAGVLVMYAMYSMTDTFIGKSFAIGIGLSQTNIIAHLNFDEDWEYHFLKYESTAYRNSATLDLAQPP